MASLVKHDVRSDNQKNNMIALPKDDLSFVFLLYVAPFHDCAACDAAGTSQSKIIEMFLRKLVLPRKTRLMIRKKIFSAH